MSSSSLLRKSHIAEVLQPLVDKLGSLITSKMNPKDGNCKFVAHQSTNDGDLSLHFDDAAAAEGTQVIVNSTLELYLMGDWKFLFMMVGRSGYCGGYCMYCRLKQSKWIAPQRGIFPYVLTCVT
jgi:hypothetical protein